MFDKGLNKPLVNLQIKCFWEVAVTMVVKKKTKKETYVFIMLRSFLCNASEQIPIQK